MGHVYTNVLISDPRRIKEIEVRMLVDTGATYACVPPKLARDLNLATMGKSDVTLADGRRVKADVSLAYMEMDGRGDIVQVRIFEISEPLVGASTLEALGLAVDPTTGKLRPTRSFIARA
ncbi:MAG: clan AA aspartic protease [Candidatus Bathyarchaeia archaeon]